MGAGRVKRWSAREERGAAAVEFALVAPLLLLLVFGIISYGYMLSFRQAVSQAAAEGARAAAVAQLNQDREQLATDAVNAAISSYQGITCADAAMTCTITVAECPDDGSPAYATIDLSYAYAENPLLPTLMVPMPDTLDYTATAQVSC